MKLYRYCLFSFLFAIFFLIQLNAQSRDSIFFNKAEQFENSSQFDSAVIYFEKAYSLISENEWEKKVTCLIKIGNNYRKGGDFKNGKRKFEEALEMGTTHLDEDHLLMASTFLGLGVIYQDANDFEKANAFYQKALSIRKKKLDNDDPLLASVYNNLGTLHLEMGQFLEGETYLIETLKIRRKKFGKDSDAVGKTYHNLGIACEESGNYLNALEYYQKALDIFLLRKESEFFASYPYGNMGGVYNLIGLYQKAIDLTNKALDIRERKLRENHPLIANGLNNLGNIFRNLGDFEKALIYFDKALQIRLEIYEGDHLDLSQVYNNISIVLTDQGKLEWALEFALKGLEIEISIRSEDHPQITNIYNNIGNIYKKNKNHEKALEYYERSLDIRLKILDHNHPLIASSYNNIADILKIQGDYTKAITFYQKALEIYEYNFGENHSGSGITYGNWSNIYFKEKDWRKSLKYLQRGLSCLATEISSNDLSQNPEFKNVKDRANTVLFLDSKAECFYQLYTEENDPSYLVFSLETSMANISIIEQSLTTFQSIKSKQFLRTQVDSIFERALFTAIKLDQLNSNGQYKEIAFNILERSQTFQLVEQLNQLNAQDFANVPDSLLKEEQNLRAIITFYNKNIWLYQQDIPKIKKQINRNREEAVKDSLKQILSTNSEKINRYKSYLFESQKELSNTLLEMENGYPEYYNMKYDFSVPSIKSIQKIVFKPEEYGSKTAILQYFIGDNNIYLNRITKDTTVFYVINKPDNFNQLINQFRDNLKSRDFLKNIDIVKAYSESGNLLFELLLKDVLFNFRNKIDRLIIIPDDVLHHVQFDMLLTKDINLKDFKNLDCSKFAYLFNDYMVSQTYSMRTLMEAINNNKDIARKVAFCGIEPVYGKRNIDNLGNSADSLLYEFTEKGISNLQNEVEDLSALFDGEVLTLTSQDATESNFLNIIKNNTFNILHLSTHGLINDDYPKYSKLLLTFTGFENPVIDDCIEVAELYDLRIQSDVVVLSACNTGYGDRIYAGEGMVSIARGFAFAGCPSIVMSMWELEGYSNLILMTDFYKNLKKGMAIDKALRKAKLSYLQNEDLGRYELIPYRWASTVPIGFMKPVFNQ